MKKSQYTKVYNYLDELDSVRNSEKEILHAQECLFEKVVRKGEYVVLTYNQVTDSPAFLAALKDEENFQSFILLFKYGRLRISRFGNIRTPAQYFLNSVEKAIQGIKNPKKSKYYFSAMPKISEDYLMLCVLRDAVRNSDSAYIKHAVENHGISEKTKARYINGSNETVITYQEYKEDEIEFLSRLVEIILYISRKDEIYIEAKKDFPYKMYDYLEKVTDTAFIQDIKKKELNPSQDGYSIEINELEEAAGIIRNAEAFKRSDNDRSNYLKELMGKSTNPVNFAKKQVYRIANAVLDLCLNFAMENSINLETTYSQSKGNIGDARFIDDFVQKLGEYWHLCKTLEHTFLEEDCDMFSKFRGTLPPWKAGADRFKKIETLKILHFGEIKKSDLGEQVEKSPQKWGVKLVIFAVLLFIISGLHIVIFSLIQETLGVLSALWTGAEDIFVILCRAFKMFGKNMIALIVVTLIGDKICSLAGVPDIMESIGSLWGFIKDGLQIIWWKIKKSKGVLKVCWNRILTLWRKIRSYL